MPTLIYFVFNDTTTSVIYTLSLHDALPISASPDRFGRPVSTSLAPAASPARSSTTARECRTIAASSAASGPRSIAASTRSEEHTSELQSQFHLVCRLLPEKKNESEKGYIES